MAITTPNMNLTVSTIGVDSGLAWEQNLNASLTVIDQHNHSPGYGVQINPTGININSDLLINANNLTLIRSSRYINESSALNGAFDLCCTYFANNNLYVNDGSGNQIQITSGGLVNATSSGISSGSATASFVSSVLVVNSASNTPANIQVGSVLLGNNVSGSHFLTLSPPSAMAANYNLVAPTIPPVISIMALDTSGNISAPYTVDNSTIKISSNVIGVPSQGITATQIANATVTTTQIAASTILSSNMASRALNASSSSGSFTSTSTSLVQITNFSLTITTTGNPIMITCFADGTTGANSSTFGCAGSSNQIAAGFVVIQRGATVISSQAFATQVNNGASGQCQVTYPVSSIVHWDNQLTPGTYTYTMYMALNQGTAVFMTNAKMLVREMI